MDLATLLAQHGGTCTWRELRSSVPRRRISAAVTSGALLRVARGRYALPSVAAARSVALGASATASHTTAALHWGWKVKSEPELPRLTLPRGRKLRAAARSGVQRHWRDLEPAEICDGWVTSPARTVIDCCLDLPFDEALAVADSAWRWPCADGPPRTQSRRRSPPETAPPLMSWRSDGPARRHTASVCRGAQKVSRGW